ncbi:hypothetical protein EV44_g0178 [Erysiphe necator]|uniref:Cyclin-dependent protein kinase regulator pho80 n=1 Tax=Uncinula necator TaxID=52586 RepID=A0A0B1P5J2_UNCNE|nr:hypothetical protein EV44_g0178 [Erysiphe necator]
MNITGFFATIFFIAYRAQAARKTAVVSLQPVDIHNPGKPTTLATISFDSYTFDAEFSSYETPILSDLISENRSKSDIKYFRVGIYDVVNESWASSTTISSVETFAKGYSPIFIINCNMEGVIESVSVKGHKIDAGMTRDFGPQIHVLKMSKGPRPYLNRPVVLKEGKVEAPVPEKSFLQKYWWLIAAALMVIISAKGDSE